MATAKKKGFVSDFRQFFFRGLATLLPTILTIVLLVKCFEFIQNNISVHITEGVCWVAVKVTEGYPGITSEEVNNYLLQNKLSVELATDSSLLEAVRRDKMIVEWSHVPKSLVGFGLAIILVYVLGRLLASYLGRKLWQTFELAVGQVPGFKHLYPYIKQVTEFLFGENKNKVDFSRVVAVAYPRKGLWSIGLVTGTGLKKLSETTNEDYLTIFIPSSPTPITGYVITVNKNEVIDIPISIEEALRFTVSGGVIVPQHQARSGQAVQLIPGPSVADDEKKN
jgi:uncharacterized membrane protein